jgi:hypothetical protein
MDHDDRQAPGINGNLKLRVQLIDPEFLAIVPGASAWYGRIKRSGARNDPSSYRETPLGLEHQRFFLLRLHLPARYRES